MQLGAFSVSLSVRDLTASRAFYEKLGFAAIGGNAGENWLIMKNGPVVIGLFHGMFDGNILTFNPGWSSEGAPLPDYTDIRTLQHQLKGQGITLTSEADESGTGPASFTLTDPDGNQILFDQHV
jgi:lactoylglutathione lyase